MARPTRPPPLAEAEANLRVSAAPSRPDVYYGGQAVVEGVMIRAPRHMAIAVRGPGGAIVRRVEELAGFTTGPLRRVPLVRGAVVLWETLSLGMRAINFSSRIAYEAALEEEKAERLANDEPSPEEEEGELGDAAIWGSMAIGIVLAVGIFFVGPVLFANFLE